MAAWVCEKCGFRNRETNTTCGGGGRLGCGSSPADVIAKMEVATNPEKPSSEVHTPNPEPDEASEWYCSCGFRNRASNALCGGNGRLGCGSARADSSSKLTATRQLCGVERDTLPPDANFPASLLTANSPWICKCGFRNRAANIRCGGVGNLGCQGPRPQINHASINQTQFASAHVVQSQRCKTMRDNPSRATADLVSGSAWICGNCAFSNQASNDKCGGSGSLGCKMPRGSAIAAVSPPSHEATDDKQCWKCPSCEHDNAENTSSCDACEADRRYIGVLKSIGVEYGFISCLETKRLYGRDVYVSKQVLDAAFRKGTVSSGVSLSFLLCFNDGGQPNARGIWPMDCQRNALEDKEFHGVIKYISEERGYGFVECQGAADYFGSDVHASLELLKGYSLGQQVVFFIRLGQIRGRPQVRKLSAVGPPPDVLPSSCVGTAATVLRGCWQQRVLLLGEGDLSFASGAAVLHPDCHLDATVYVDERQWHDRFPEYRNRASSLTNAGHDVRFGVDATQEPLMNCSAVFFNFPCVSVREPGARRGSRSPSGDLAFGFLENAKATADFGTLVVLGLWGRCDGGIDPRLYGQDSHELVAEAIATPCAERGSALEDALPGGYVRGGVKADYGFYGTYEAVGYNFRTNCAAAFET
eukprot:gb/GFBE01023394.1/.p1 GENE.gb/GFBE01023394.1/~~gb/GFBE01023394.1/.p1  ORF type:complete len:645 (+),score=36.21 gb/GFBE01023394.1/:1-1935(+)